MHTKGSYLKTGKKVACDFRAVVTSVNPQTTCAHVARLLLRPSMYTKGVYIKMRKQGHMRLSFSGHECQSPSNMCTCCFPSSFNFFSSSFQVHFLQKKPLFSSPDECAQARCAHDRENKFTCINFLPTYMCTSSSKKVHMCKIQVLLLVLKKRVHSLEKNDFLRTYMCTFSSKSAHL